MRWLVGMHNSCISIKGMMIIIMLKWRIIGRRRWRDIVWYCNDCIWDIIEVNLSLDVCQKFCSYVEEGDKQFSHHCSYCSFSHHVYVSSLIQNTTHTTTTNVTKGMDLYIMDLEHRMFVQRLICYFMIEWVRWSIQLVSFEKSKWVVILHFCHHEWEESAIFPKLVTTTQHIFILCQFTLDTWITMQCGD